MTASASLRRAACLAGAALAVASLAACLSERPALPVPRSADLVVDRTTCEGRYVTSIWKGLDTSGPECAGFLAAAGAPLYDRGRIQRVCEHAELRMILTGEAPTAFTQQACSRHQPEYQLATLHRACRQVSRARRAELTPAQSAACERYLSPLASSPGARVLAGGDALSTGPRASRPATVAGVLASSAGPALEAAEDEPSCEDRYVESIWKGEDLQGGSECAAPGDPAAALPQYRLARIQNVCEGAQARAIRRGEGLPFFTQQACGSLLESLRASEAAAPAPAVAVSEPSALPAAVAPSGAGLEEAAVQATVDENWRSIGRHCWSVAPRTSIPWAPANTEVLVTLTVAASGHVRDVSARAGGRRELESCIEGSIRLWQFPAAGSDTRVELPLLFAGE